MWFVIVYNPIGLMMVFLPAVLASLASVYFPRSADTWTFVGFWGAAVLIWDVLYRIFNREEHWLSPNRGGHFFFVPVCILGIAAAWWYVHRATMLGYWLPHTTPDGFSPFQ
ncbi:hypothetical protein ACXR0O_10265 [Verrucomicrobiota bacterium sgz303538]